jgi:DNA-binding NarL/FixJ family response regulator
MIRVVLADDHAIVRAGVRALLAPETDITVVAEAADGLEAVAQAEKHQPDVLLLDLTMPKLNGVEALSRVKAKAPRTRVLVLSMHAGAEFARPALRAGAHGYVVKGAGLDELVTALRQVAAGERFLDPLVEGLDGPAGGDPVGVEGLTPREREVLRRVAEGGTNRQIADELGLSPKTVDTHRTNLMRKLGVHDAQALTRLAMRHGLITPGV